LKKWVYNLVIAVILTGCCTSQKVATKRMNRMVKCNPSLLSKDTLIIRDSIRVTDTVVIESASVDTSFFSNLADTVIIENDRIEIQYIRKDSLIYLTGRCKEDTVFIDKKVYITKEVLVDKIVVKEPTLAEELGSFGKNLLFLLILIALGYLTFKIIKKRIL
tara:strand:- start:291 stop:776 length:486 start_codon:yes stop_codon:yes gene_type:complete